METTPPRRSARIGLTGALSALVVVSLVVAGGVGFAKNSVSAGQYQYGKKVTICHKGKVTITISRSALPAHLAHGDKLGPCENGKKKKQQQQEAKKKAEQKAEKAKEKAKDKSEKADAKKEKAEEKAKDKSDKAEQKAENQEEKKSDDHGKSDEDHGKGQGPGKGKK
jgi:Mg-chelatase subunit ChlI